MTMITYRDTSKRPSLPSSITGGFSLSALTARLSDRWSKWQAAREFEAMPLDMRKDFGWPAADISDHRA